MTIKQKITKIAAAGIAVMISAAAVPAQVQTLYDMAADNNIQQAQLNSNLNVGASNGLFATNVPPHDGQPEGRVAVIQHQGSRALEITGRTQNWMGLDIRRDGIRNRLGGNFLDGKYSIIVTGTVPTSFTIPAGAVVTLSVTDGPPWTEFGPVDVSNDNRNFVLRYEPFAMAGSAFGELQYNFRIQTRSSTPTMPLIITSIVVRFEPDDDFVDWPAPAWNTAIASMKDKFAGIFQIGNIMSPGNTINLLNSPHQCTTFFKKHYNAVTLENHMKPSYLMPAANTTVNSAGFRAADSVVNWANANGIDVIGHTLVWHSQSANWLYRNSSGQPLTRAQARQNMETYINLVAGHFRGKLAAWDVVNEAFMNIGECFAEAEDWRDALRSSPCHRRDMSVDVNDHTNQQLSPWYDAYANEANAAAGEHASDYIYDAFVFARLADTSAKLYYNDFNEEFPLKRESIARMTIDLNTKWAADERNRWPGRLLIEGLGMQSHYYGGGVEPVATATYNLEYVDATIKRFAETGARISITELDIPMGGWRSDDRYSKAKLSAGEEALQGKLYADLMRTYLKYAEHIDRITFWGMSDGTSWRAHGMPLIFDNSLRPKAAFDSIMALDIGNVSVKSSDRVAGLSNAKRSNMRVTANRSAINVRFNAANSGETVIKLFNLKGDVIQTVKVNTVAGKNYSHSFKQKRLPNGFYVVRMQNGNIVEQSRVMMSK
ncbi:MAG: endo-1,4-beta-xylanase [Chitinispirillia bacterium]|nr:endo-1,4-beta-xylanase [Chitinispirillia bacterium]